MDGLAVHHVGFRHSTWTGVHSRVLGLTVQRVGAVFEDAFDPLVEKEPRTIHELVQHACWKKVRQFQLEMVDKALVHANRLYALSLSGQLRDPFGNNQKSDHNARAIKICIWLAQSRNDSVSATLGRAKVDEQNLIVVVVNNFAQRLAAADHIRRRELTLEYRELEMVPEAAHELKDPPQPLIIRDVVADQV